MPQTVYEWSWIFLIYAFLGWCAEEVFHAVRNGKFVNRGLLNGPWCPIYGFGMIILVLSLFPLRQNLLLLFIGSTILTTLLELVTGLVLDKVFHSHWWDYSQKPFQFHGYICLQFSLTWGIAGTFVIAVVHETVYRLLGLVPFYVGCVVLVIVMAAFVLDCYITVRTVLNLRKRVRALDDVSAVLRQISDDIGEDLFRNVESISDMASSSVEVLEASAEEAKQKAERKRELYQMRLDAISTWGGFHKSDLEMLRKKSREAFSNRHFGEMRLLKAFPGVRFVNHNESLQKYKNYLLNSKNRKQSENEQN